MEHRRQLMEHRRQLMERPRELMEHLREMMERPKELMENLRDMMERPREMMERPRRRMEHPRHQVVVEQRSAAVAGSPRLLATWIWRTLSPPGSLSIQARRLSGCLFAGSGIAVRGGYSSRSYGSLAT